MERFNSAKNFTFENDDDDEEKIYSSFNRRALVQEAQEAFVSSGGNADKHIKFLEIAMQYITENPENCWCTEKKLMTDLLYVFTLKKKTETLLKFEVASELELSKCSKCIVEYHNSQEMFIRQYTDKETVSPIRARFLEHDINRLSAVLGSESLPKARHLACFEIFMHVNLYESSELQRLIVQLLEKEPTCTFGLTALPKLPATIFLALFHKHELVMKWSRNILRSVEKLQLPEWSSECATLVAIIDKALSLRISNASDAEDEFASFSQSAFDFPVTLSTSEIYKSLRQWVSMVEFSTTRQMLNEFPALASNCMISILRRADNLWTLSSLLGSILVALDKSIWKCVTASSMQPYLNPQLYPDMRSIAHITDTETLCVLTLLHVLLFGHSEALQLLRTEAPDRPLVAKMQNNLLSTCFALLSSLVDMASLSEAIKWTLQLTEELSIGWSASVSVVYRSEIFKLAAKVGDKVPSAILARHLVEEIEYVTRLDDGKLVHASFVKCTSLLLDAFCAVFESCYVAFAAGCGSSAMFNPFKSHFEITAKLIAQLTVDLSRSLVPVYRNVLSVFVAHKLPILSSKVVTTNMSPFNQHESSALNNAVLACHSCLFAILDFVASSDKMCLELPWQHLAFCMYSPNANVASASSKCLQRQVGATIEQVMLKYLLVQYPSDAFSVFELPVSAICSLLGPSVCALDCLQSFSRLLCALVACLSDMAGSPSEAHLRLFKAVVFFLHQNIHNAYCWGHKQLADSASVGLAVSGVFELADCFSRQWTKSWFVQYESLTNLHLEVSVLYLQACEELLKWLKVRFPELLSKVFSLLKVMLQCKFYFKSSTPQAPEIQRLRDAVFADLSKRLSSDKSSLSAAQKDELWSLLRGVTDIKPARVPAKLDSSSVSDTSAAKLSTAFQPPRLSRPSSEESLSLKQPKQRKLDFSVANLDQVWKEHELAAKANAAFNGKQKSFAIGRGAHPKELTAMEKLKGPKPINVVRGRKPPMSLEEKGYTYIKAPVLTASSIAAAAHLVEDNKGSQSEDAGGEMSSSDWLNMSEDASKARASFVKGAHMAPADQMETKVLDANGSVVSQSGLKTLNAANETKRREMVLEMLHEKLLSWDPESFLDAAMLSNALKKLMVNLIPVKDTFRHVSEYEDVFEPLLVLELWEQMAHNMEAFDSGELTAACELLELRDVCSVDQFMDLVVVLRKQKLGYYQDHDVFLLYAKPFEEFSTEKRVTDQVQNCIKIFGKVKTFTLNKHKMWEMTLRTCVDAANVSKLAQLRQCLIPGKHCLAGLPLFGLASVHREYSALASVSQFPLLKPILNPRLINGMKSMRLSDEYSKIQTLMKLNDFQIKAIATAYETSYGFTLIQGPPGTGKTRTILALIALFLTRKRATLIGAPNLPVTSANRGDVSIANKKNGLLICAPSNAAIDEIVRRLRNGIIDVNGRIAFPKIVRIGAPEAVHDDVRDLLLDSLLEERLVESDSLKNDNETAPEDAAALKERLVRLKEDILALKNDLYNAKDTESRVKLEVALRGMQELKFSTIQSLDALRAQKLTNKAIGDKLRLKMKRRILEEANVIASTLNASGHEVLKECGCKFDHVIVDEAGQAVELSTLIPLQYGVKSCVLVGDVNQLPPTVLSSVAQKNKYEQSLFQRIGNVKPELPLMLSMQYRMHPEISKLPSKLFYDNKLVDAPGLAKTCSASWHLSSPLLGPYRFFNISDGFEITGRGHSIYNTSEVDACIQLLCYLTALNPCVCFAYKIAIITPYNVQLTEIRKSLERQFGSNIRRYVQISTIDGFQGQEKDIIIFSTVRSYDSKGYSSGIGFLADERRMNVALTRAKHSLFVLGNSDFVSRNKNWRILVEDSKERGLLTNYRPNYTFSENPKTFEKLNFNQRNTGSNLYPPSQMTQA